MKWRVLMEVVGPDGRVQVHEISSGASSTDGTPAAALELTIVDSKAMLAGVQRHLVQAQVAAHCWTRRRCPRCGVQRPLKDLRFRRLTSLFGVVKVRALVLSPAAAA